MWSGPPPGVGDRGTEPILLAVTKVVGVADRPVGGWEGELGLSLVFLTGVLCGVPGVMIPR